MLFVAQGVVFGLTVGVMLLGLLGIFLPVLPGLPLMWVALLGYALLDQFQSLDGWTFALLTLLTIAGFGSQFFVSHAGAHVHGASKWGGFAAFVGGLLALPLLPPFGTLLGALLGMFLVELIRQRNWRAALRSSWGWLAGWTAGTGLQVAAGVLIIAIFVARVLWHNATGG